MEDEREDLENGYGRVDLTKGPEDAQEWESWQSDMGVHEEVSDSWAGPERSDTNAGAYEEVTEFSVSPQIATESQEDAQPAYQQGGPDLWNAPTHSEDAAQQPQVEVRYVEREGKRTRNWIGVGIGAVLVVVGLIFALGASSVTGLPTSVSVPSATFGADFYTYIYQAVASACTAMGELGTQVAQVAALAVQLCQGIGLLICAVGGATIAAGLRKS